MRLRANSNRSPKTVARRESQELQRIPSWRQLGPSRRCCPNVPQLITKSRKLCTKAICQRSLTAKTSCCIPSTNIRRRGLTLVGTTERSKRSSSKMSRTMTLHSRGKSLKIPSSSKAAKWRLVSSSSNQLQYPSRTYSLRSRSWKTPNATSSSSC